MITKYFNETMGSIQTFTDLEGKIWFLAKDLARMLEFDNQRHMMRIVPDKERTTKELKTAGGKQKVTFVSESGLYRIVFKCHQARAEEFCAWISDVVLPSIRKDGGYIEGQENLSEEEREKLTNIIRDLKEFVDDQLEEIDDLRNECEVLKLQLDLKESYDDLLKVCDWED